MLLLVRSAIVEVKISRKNGEVPTLVMSSLIKKEEQAKQADTETPEKEQDVDTKEVPEIKLETVEEHPKEETASDSRSIIIKLKPDK